MPDDDDIEAYFQVIQEEDGYSVLTDMNTDELTIVQNIIANLMEIRGETPSTIH